MRSVELRLQMQAQVCVGILLSPPPAVLGISTGLPVRIRVLPTEGFTFGLSFDYLLRYLNRYANTLARKTNRYLDL